MKISWIKSSIIILGLAIALVSCSLTTLLDDFGGPWLSQADFPEAIDTYDALPIRDGVSIVWTRSGVYSTAGAHPIIASSPERFHVLGSMHREIGPRVIAFDKAEGTILWESEFREGIVIADNTELIIEGGVGKLSGIEPSNGIPLWTTRLPGSRSVTYVYISDDTVYARAAPDSYFLISAQTGDILEHWRYEDLDRVYFDILDVRVGASQSVTSLVGVDPVSKEYIWEIPLGDRIPFGPSTFKNHIIARLGRDDGPVISIDPKTGNLLWESKIADLVSNIAVGEKAAYGLRKTGELIQISLSDGSILPLVDFTSEELTVVDDDLHPRPFRIGLSNDQNYLLVLLGDSRQLFAIQLDS